MSTKTNLPEYFDPDVLQGWSSPLERLRCEAAGVKMMANDLSPLQKLETTLFIVFWMLWTAAWLFQLIEPHPVLIVSYAIVTSALVGIYVRMHNIELEKMTRMFETGITISTNSDSSPESEREDDEQ